MRCVQLHKQRFCGRPRQFQSVEGLSVQAQGSSENTCRSRITRSLVLFCGRSDFRCVSFHAGIIPLCRTFQWVYSMCLLRNAAASRPHSNKRVSLGGVFAFMHRNNYPEMRRRSRRAAASNTRKLHFYKRGAYCAMLMKFGASFPFDRD
jgi:hypothetical protein